MLVGVFADDELLRVRVIAGVNPHLVYPFGRFHRCVGFEMDVGDDRHIAPALAQALDDVLEVARVLDSRRSDPDDFTIGVCQLDRLLDRRLGVHRVAGNHRLDTDRVITTDPDVAHLHLARLATVINEWTLAVGQLTHVVIQYRPSTPARGTSVKKSS